MIVALADPATMVRAITIAAVRPSQRRARDDRRISASVTDMSGSPLGESRWTLPTTGLVIGVDAEHSGGLSLRRLAVVERFTAIVR